MSFMITAECINCSACEMECPVRAIWPGPSQWEIDPGVCIECDGYFPVPRCAWVCPVDACVAERAGYLERAATMAKRGSPPIVLTAGHAAGRVVQPA
jgi:ferredoxin